MHLHPILSNELADAIVADRHRAAADRSNSRLAQRSPEPLAAEREVESHQRARQRVRDSLLRIAR